jgi:hypothetical protein
MAVVAVLMRLPFPPALYQLTEMFSEVPEPFVHYTRSSATKQE